MAKKALIVAINDYGHPANNLPSCVADAQAMADLFETRFGIVDTRQLYDKDATLEAVEEGLDWLFQDATKDDRLVFYFSGHGYQAPKGSTLDEVLVLRENKFLPDDRLSSLSQGVPEGTLTVILDSCFSGGLDKIPIFFDDRVELAVPKRWTPTDSDLLAAEVKSFKRVKNYRPFGCEAITGIKRKSFSLSSKGLSVNPASPDEVAQPRLNGLLLSACLETETASASTSKTDGLSAFTYGLITSLKDLPGNCSNRSLMEAAASQLSTLSFRQTPVLKEPPAPPKIAERSFITFDEAASKPGAASHAASAAEILESIFRLFLKQGEGEKMTATTMYGNSHSQDKGLFDLLPVLINVLSKGYQPGLQGASNGQAQNKGLFDLLPVLINVLTKGYQPGMQGSSGMQSQDKGLIDLLPVLLGALTKGYQPGIQAYPGGQAQDKGLLDLLPVIIGALTKGYQPATPAAAPNEQEKFLNFLIPVLTTAVPTIINAVSKDYQPSMQPNGTAASADQEKFLNILIPVLTSAVPAIIDAVTKGYQPGMTSNPGMSAQDKGLFDLLPVIIGALTKGYQPGMPIYVDSQSQDKGLFDLLPVLLGALTKSQQPQANMGSGGSMTH